MATQKGRNWSSGDIVTAANLSSVERGVSAVSSLYEPTTWANGDTVTAAALNNIEQGIVNADGGGQSWVTLCEEEVTTETTVDGNLAFLSYSQLISADTIRVTFDETTYTCNIVNQDGSSTYYGGVGETGPDFSEYPFAFISSGFNPTDNVIYTETAGTHTVKIEALQESGSSDFSTAELRITNNTESNFFLDIITVTDEDGIGHGVACLAYESRTFLVVLYKNYATSGTYTPESLAAAISASGSIEIDEEYGDVYVSGDCIITLYNSLPE